MIEFKKVSGWDLRNHDAYVSRDRIMFLWAPLSEEGLDLGFDLVNILPPRGKIFWNFFKYRAFNAGASDFFQRFLNDETLSRLDEYSDYYWGDRVQSWFSNRAAMQYFGEYFFVPGTGEAGLISVVVPINGVEVIFDYFKQLVCFFESSSCIDCEGVADFFRVKSAKDFFSGGELIDFSLSDAEKVSFVGLYSELGLPDKVSVVADLDRYLRVFGWLVENLPAHKIESIKDWVGTPYWGGVDSSFARNSIRMIVDKCLANYPAIQTNPYEGFIG
ncbi:hypothetical protein [Vandammella animalimorsus]|uniref:hypothetical protein n=1 Tax=Vandammella animalimorsus TaxID=2029117 RepID=UPI0011778976|nr:hypothetical protein [Vandammella animalimorsus]